VPSIVKSDPWWLADPHRKAYVYSSLLGPTALDFWAYNPAYAQLQNEHVWGDIITGGMTPEAAAEKAFKRVGEIFAKYPIAQA
jgi:ABC-type glycerol-3-phosphate transport system substrate-binding protein